MSERTPEEREAARRERERRRALREGRTPPPEPDERAFEYPTGTETPAPPASPPMETQPTQQFDVTVAWAGEPAVVVAEAEPERAPEPAADPEPERPLGTRRVTAHEHPRFGRRGGRGGPTRTAGADASADRGDQPPGPTPSMPKRRRTRWAVALIALVVLAAVAWFLNALYQPFNGTAGARINVTIPRGATAGQVGDLLAAKGVIDSSFFFGARAALAGERNDLKSGTFTLRKDMSYGAALDALTHNPPPPPVIRVTIPEGRSRGEAAPLVRADGIRGDYLAASRASKLLDPHRYGAPRNASLEGFLFPATYELRRGSTAKQLVAEQLAAFKQRLASLDLRYAKSKNLTVFDVVVIASMVEREVAVPRERRLVAAVIYNRLHQGIPLGIDATLRYALHDWSKPLTVSQLASTSPYNTRNHQGLPPGPIGSPGFASLQAAAHPARVSYLFYVVKPGTCGEHAFSSTDAQFQRDVARYNAARAAKGGKSPTTC